MRFITLIPALATLVLPKLSAGFQPPGQFDIGPKELDAICPMMEALVKTQRTPQHRSLGPEPKSGDCIWYKWINCPKPKTSDPNIPCGWYEQQLCSSTRKKRRSLSNVTRQTVPEAHVPDMAREKRSPPDHINKNDHFIIRNKDYFLVFPDESPEI